MKTNLLAALTLCFLPACTQESIQKKDAPANNSNVAVPASIFVDAAPAGAIGIQKALLDAKAGSDIVIRGRIGGRKKAFVDGRAILVAADPALKPCPTEEGCPTPWDYCCEGQDTLIKNTMTVQVVDAKGAPLATTLKGVHGLKELAHIVVAGTLKSANGGLVLNAKQIHIEKP